MITAGGTHLVSGDALVTGHPLAPRSGPQLLPPPFNHDERGCVRSLAALVVLQGAIGWWMVASGLSERTDVSQIRLAIHLTLACAIFAATIWVICNLAIGSERHGLGRASRLAAYALPALLLVQLFLGGLVAGLNAGFIYNSWPLIEGRFIPPLSELYPLTPAWLNHLETVKTVQFQHRMLAYGLVLLALWHAFVLVRRRAAGPAGRAMAVQASIVAGLARAQAAVGIMTLLLVVPVWSALLHQALAVVLLGASIVHAHAMARGAGRMRRSPRLLRIGQSPIRRPLTSETQP